MSHKNTQDFLLYGFNGTSVRLFPRPIIEPRDPVNGQDQGKIGQVWSNSVSAALWFCNAPVTWVLLAAQGGADTFLSVTSTTFVNAGTTMSAGTTITAGTGIVSTTGNIVATAGQVNAGTTMTAGTGITSTTGNITALNGNFVLSTAGTFFQLPGPVIFRSGAGAPAGALALNVGDTYINTTAASATTRMYIATAPGAWTNVTCAA